LIAEKTNCHTRLWRSRPQPGPACWVGHRARLRRHVCLLGRRLHREFGYGISTSSRQRQSDFSVGFNVFASASNVLASTSGRIVPSDFSSDAATELPDRELDAVGRPTPW
jgi:hypothetical protein